VLAIVFVTRRLLLEMLPASAGVLRLVLDKEDEIMFL
jgi:hypothetical protein